MLARQFFDKCTSDTKDIFVAYLRICDSFTDTKWVSESEFGEKHYIYDKKDKIAIDEHEERFFILLYLSAYSKTEIGQMFLEHGIDVDKYYDVSRLMVSQMRESLNHYFDNFYSERIERFLFKNRDSLAGGVLTSYSDIDKDVICLPRTLLNLKERFNKYPRLVEAFKLNELYDEFEQVACQIEGEQVQNAESTLVRPSHSTMIRPKKKIFKYGENLCDKEYPYNPLIGREKELRNLMAVLADDEKSAIIHGLAGVGKTTIVRGLAYNILHGMVPSFLENKQIFEITASELIRGCQYVGMVEDRMLEIIQSLLNVGDSILFVDEIHTLMGLGAGSKSNNDVSNILKPYLGDGRIKIIGATTSDEYKLIKDNGAFSRRFKGIEVLEPKKEELLTILNTYVNRFYETKGISFAFPKIIQKFLLTLMIELSQDIYQVPTDKLCNPDLALTILRSAYNYAKIDGKTCLDASVLIEGVENQDNINQTGKDYFKEKVLTLTR